MTPPKRRGRGTAHDALAEAALRDDRIGYIVLVAVREASGQVVDFVHELVNARAEATAGKPLQGRSLLDAFGAERRCSTRSASCWVPGRATGAR